jgi:hypothetical protein
MFKDRFPLTGTSCLKNPTEVTTKTSFPEALIVNLPASSVAVVRDVPFTCTVACVRGVLAESVTVPVIVCENAAQEKSERENKKSNLFRGAECCLSFFPI